MATMSIFTSNLESLLQLEDEQFVISCYQLFFLRQPDAAGLSHHLDLLKLGSTRRQILMGLMTNPEAKFGNLAAMKIAFETFDQSRKGFSKRWFRKILANFRQRSLTSEGRSNALHGRVSSKTAGIRLISATQDPVSTPLKDRSQPCIWFDLSTSLMWQGGVVGIVRAELELAVQLKLLQPGLRFSLQVGEGFAEVSANDLDWLLSAENPADAYMRFFGRYSDEDQSRQISITVPTTKVMTHPYIDGDVIVSVGWMDSNKEHFFSKLKKDTAVKICYLVYDLILLLASTKHFYDVAHSVDFYRYVGWVFRNCDLIFYGGETARKDAENFAQIQSWPIPPGQVLKFGMASTSADSLINEDELLARIGINGPFLMTVGSIEPRKNHETLYRAYLLALDLLPDQQLPQILFCGRTGSNVNDFLDTIDRDPRVKGKIIVYSPSDGELTALYKRCAFTLLPSVYEGWSLTLPESLGHRKFCLASDTPPLREIGDGLVEFVSPFDAMKWAEKIAYYSVNSEAVLQAENKIGEQWAASDWKATAEEMLNRLNLLLELPRSSAIQTSRKQHVGEEVPRPTIWMDLTLSFLDWSGNVTGVVRAELNFAKYLKSIASDTRYFAYQNGHFFLVADEMLDWLFSGQDVSADYRKFQLYWKDQEARGTGYRNPLLRNGELDLFNPNYIRSFPDNSTIFFAGIDFGYYDQEGMVRLSRNQAVLPLCDDGLNITKVQLVYDLTPELFPHLHKVETVEGYRPFLDFVSNEFDHLVYGGRTAMRDGLSLQADLSWREPYSTFVEFGADIHQSMDELSSTENATLIAKLGVSEPYALMVGTYEPRKNHEVIYRAYLTLLEKKMLNRDFKIVFAGHKGWKSNDLFAQISRDSRVFDKIVMISPNDAELDILYKNCEFTLLPSFYEGWSLTLPEALSYCKFCLAADVEPLRETGADYIDYIHPLDSSAWANRIAYYVNNVEERVAREILIKEGWQARTWRESTEMLVERLHQGHLAALSARSISPKM